MSYFKNTNKLLILAIIVLLVTNIATIATIFYKKNEIATESQMKCYQMPENKKDRFGHFMQKRLNLNDEQNQKFGKLRDKYHQKGEIITDGIHQNRKLLYVELAKEQVNLDTMAAISDKIGQLHSQLKQISIQHYLEMKQICTPEQQKELYKLFKNAFEREERPMNSRKFHNREEFR